MQRLWSLLQGPRQGAAHRAQEGQHPDQEEEAKQVQDFLRLQLQLLNLQYHFKLEQLRYAVES